jgi:hypothetical protein
MSKRLPSQVAMTQHEEIFECWSPSEITPDARKHPRDIAFLERTQPAFDFSGLPGCFMGPLRTAPVVLLYSAPGPWDPADSVGARAIAMQNWCARTRTGTEPLPDDRFWPDCWKWWKAHTKRFGDWQNLKTKVAFLNLMPYHMRGDFKDRDVIGKLPTSTVAMKWANETLFTAAREKKRVVVCMRAQGDWNLSLQEDGYLFAPNVNPRSGYMHLDEFSSRVVEAVNHILRL